MKAIVFGGTGFIGSHVVEQLHEAGHEVLVPVRKTSDTTFLKKLGVTMVPVDFSNPESIQNVITGDEVIYNCTAAANLQTDIHMEAPVEIQFTRNLVKAAVLKGVTRFIQLSSIVVYDFQTNEAINESYISTPEFPLQHLLLKREQIVEEAGRESGMTTIILRPASTIGIRDKASFFSRLYAAHLNDVYPMSGQGKAHVSLVDTRDIGQALVWLGENPDLSSQHHTFLLKGFDTTWQALKTMIDQITGRIAKTADMASDATDFTSKTFTTNRIWDDAKIRDFGFETKYSLKEAAAAAIGDFRK